MLPERYVATKHNYFSKFSFLLSVKKKRKILSSHTLEHTCTRADTYKVQLCCFLKVLELIIRLPASLAQCAVHLLHTHTVSYNFSSVFSTIFSHISFLHIVSSNFFLPLFLSSELNTQFIFSVKIRPLEPVWEAWRKVSLFFKRRKKIGQMMTRSQLREKERWF